MVALVNRRMTKEAAGQRYTDPVKAGVIIHEGALVVLDAGWLAPGRTAVGLRARGVAQKRADNLAGANGALECVSHPGVWSFENDASINRTHIGATAYIFDDQTVAATDGGGTRSAAGTITHIDAQGVWVKIV